MKTERIFPWLLGVPKLLCSFLAPVLRGAVAEALVSLLPIAEDAVLSLVDDPRGGEEKRRYAADAIKAAALQAGVRATSRVVNLAIELALAKMEEGR